MVDARLANTFFAAPPATALPNGAAFSRIACSKEEPLLFGGLDLKDYFYHLGLPVELRPYFQMPGFCAGLLHRDGFGKQHDAHVMVYLPQIAGRADGLESRFGCGAALL